LQTTIDSVILSRITGTTSTTKLDKSTWKIQKNIKLSDGEFYQPGGIDLLIGADLFYQIFQSGRHKRTVNYPVLQATVLGWTFSGRNPATTTQNDRQQTILLREDKFLEHKLNIFL